MREVVPVGATRLATWGVRRDGGSIPTRGRIARMSRLAGGRSLDLSEFRFPDVQGVECFVAQLGRGFEFSNPRAELFDASAHAAAHSALRHVEDLRELWAADALE